MFIKGKQRFGLSLFGILICFLLVIFLPFIFAKSYAQSQVENSINDLTIFQKDSVRRDLLTPQFAVFSKKDNHAKVSFVELEREWMILWRVKEITSQTIDVSEGLADEDQNEVLELSLNDLRRAVEDGRLTRGDDEFLNRGLSSVFQRDVDYEPGSVIKSIPNPTGEDTSSVELVATGDGDENELLINDHEIGLKNITAPVFDTEGKNLYYEKYLYYSDREGPEEVEYQGIVYKYNLASGEESEVYNFGSKSFLTLGANSKYLAYTMGDEVGFVDLQTKERAVFDNSLIKQNYIDESQYGTDSSMINRVEVLDIGEKSCLIILKGTVDSDLYFRAFFESKTIESAK